MYARWSRPTKHDGPDQTGWRSRRISSAAAFRHRLRAADLRNALPARPRPMSSPAPRPVHRDSVSAKNEMLATASVCHLGWRRALPARCPAAPNTSPSCVVSASTGSSTYVRGGASHWLASGRRGSVPNRQGARPPASPGTDGLIRHGPFVSLPPSRHHQQTQFVLAPPPPPPPLRKLYSAGPLPLRPLSPPPAQRAAALVC